MKEKAIPYCRVSSKDQEVTGYSLDSQERDLNAYAKRKDFLVVDVIKISESASGKQIRKAFNNLFELANEHDVNHILCEKVDRLTRTPKDAAIADEWVKADPKRSIHFVKENFILNSETRAHENLMWDMKVAIARFYINNLSEEVKKGQKEKLSQGWLPKKPPVGYKTVGEEGHKIHVIDSETSPYIKKIFRLYSSGNYSMKALVETMFQEGMRTKSGKKIPKSKVESILGNPFYYGALRWNDALVGMGAHEPLISKEEFDRVTDIRTGKKSAHFTRHQFLFRKMFKCGDCGGTVTAEIQKGIIYYHCNHYRDCKQKKYTSENVLEEKLMGVFKFFEQITPAEAEVIKAKIKQDHAQEAEYKENIIRGLNDQYNRLQRRLDTLYDDRLDGAIDQEFWKRKELEITTEQKTIQQQLERLKKDEAKYFEVWLNILDLARRAREIYEKRSPEERRLLISHIFSNLILTDEKVELTLKKPVEVLAKRIQERIDSEIFFEPKKKLTGQSKGRVAQPVSNGLLGYMDSNHDTQDQNLMSYH